MGFEINRPLSVGGINPNIYVDRNNRYNTGFANTLTADTFERTSNDRFTTEAAIKKMIETNPKVKHLTKDFNPNLTLNMQELRELLSQHAADTKNITKGIIENLPFALQTRVDAKAIEDASYLHDLGKVLIPPEILNKPARLDAKETKIMHTHSELSYELLKNSGLNEKTLKLIRNHHQNAKRTGYPWVDKDFNADLNLQILSLADKYSALTEKRTYKEPMSSKQALTILYQDVQEGKVNPVVFKALVNYAQATKAKAIA
jgi:putative nucleotidyltransferase with HDIG domain